MSRSLEGISGRANMAVGSVLTCRRVVTRWPTLVKLPVSLIQVVDPYEYSSICLGYDRLYSSGLASYDAMLYYYDYDGDVGAIAIAN